MNPVHFEEILDTLLAVDDRYARESYHFVREALDHTQRKIYKLDAADRAPENRHVTGRQLLEGAREYALQEFGPMAYDVLQEWGIRRCEDLGEIVFNLVEHGRGMFGTTEQDSRDDFRDGYSFEEAFRDPFWPVHRRCTRSRHLSEA